MVCKCTRALAGYHTRLGKMCLRICFFSSFVCDHLDHGYNKEKMNTSSVVGFGANHIRYRVFLYIIPKYTMVYLGIKMGFAEGKPHFSIFFLL
jgi:hypothetical protein